MNKYTNILRIIVQMRVLYFKNNFLMGASQNKSLYRQILHDVLAIFLMLHYSILNCVEIMIDVKFRDVFLDNSAIIAGVGALYYFTPQVERWKGILWKYNDSNNSK
jgi:hypothetical protein